MVMDVTPDAIVIVDTRLYIQDMSPSAERMLHVRYVSSAIGKPLQTILPFVDGFAQVRNTGKALLNSTIRVREDLVVEQTIVPVEGENLLMGILRDVTDRELQRAELDHLRTETLSHTSEVIKNQMRVAQEIAELLGETTAETKIMLSRLAKLLQGESK
jgi:sensor histidine kinase regulating citrate/malate metabolism